MLLFGLGSVWSMMKNKSSFMTPFLLPYFGTCLDTKLHLAINKPASADPYRYYGCAQFSKPLLLCLGGVNGKGRVYSATKAVGSWEIYGASD